MSDTAVSSLPECPTWNVKAAAKYLGVCTRTLVRYVNGGKLRALRPGGRRLRFLKTDLDAFVEASALAPATPTV